MSRTKMVVMKDWLDQVEKRANQEQKYELCYKLLRYGIYEEYEESGDPLVNVLMDMYLPQVDAMQEAYDIKVSNAQKGGRPSTIDNKQIWTLAKQGFSGTDIASKLGIPKTTVYSSLGWKNRKEENYEN